MTDRAVELLLAACRESGALAVLMLFYEIEGLAKGREFTTGEIVAHARVPANGRLALAINAACGGEIDARRLGRLLSQWRGKDVGLCSVIVSIGSENGLILWKFKPVDPLHESPIAANDALIPASKLQY